MLKRRLNSKLVRSLLVGGVAILLTFGLWGLGWLDTWELKSWDWRVALFARPGKATNAIRVIRLDQASLDWGERENGLPWPWYRQVFAGIIDYCRRSGVKAIAFDVLFTEFSRAGVADDEALGAAIAEAGNFAGALALGRATGSDESWPAELPPPRIVIDGLEAWLRQTGSAAQVTFPRTKIPIPEVTQHAAVLCNVQQDPEKDGIYREVKVFGMFDQHVFPSLGLGTYLAAHPHARLQITRGTLMVDDYVIPIDDAGNAVLRYHGPSGTHPWYNAANILQAEMRALNGEEATAADRAMADDLKDRYVLFGYTAPGLFDLRPIPLEGKYPGVEINATMLDNLLSVDFIRKTPRWVPLLLLCLLPLSGAVAITFCVNPLQDVLIGGIFVCIPVGLALSAYPLGFWLPFAVVETATLLSIVAALVLDYMIEGQQKRFIKNAFKHYLSPAVIEQLIRNPEQLKLGGERRTLSIYFSDLQGFTSLSEGLSPEDLTALLNEYLTAMTDIIQEEQGTIDKYEGDAIIAFWNAPLSVPDHANRAVRSALRCQAKLAEMRPEFRARVHQDLFMRIGLNTGVAVVGNMGSRAHFDYTMIGDAVNLASRLEGANKQFGSYTMLSQFTLAEMNEPSFAVRELARVAVVGRQEPVTVYEPMLREEYEAQKERFETFAEALALFYRGSFTHARELFASIKERDPAAAAYAEKCRAYIMNPPESWQGVWMLTSK